MSLPPNFFSCQSARAIPWVQIENSTRRRRILKIKKKNPTKSGIISKFIIILLCEFRAKQWHVYVRIGTMTSSHAHQFAEMTNRSIYRRWCYTSMLVLLITFDTVDFSTVYMDAYGSYVYVYYMYMTTSKQKWMNVEKCGMQTSVIGECVLVVRSML